MGKLAANSGLCLLLKIPLRLARRDVAKGPVATVCASIIYTFGYLFYFALLGSGANMSTVIPIAQLQV